MIAQEVFEMRICMVSQYLPRVGGIERIVSSLATNLVKEGHEVHVVTPLLEDTNEEEQLDGVYIHRYKGAEIRYPLEADWLIAMLKRLKAVCIKYKIQVIHAHFAKNEGVIA